MKSPYLAIAIEAVKAAETVIMQHYHSDLAVQTKADLSPVTIADQQAEDIIKQTITAAFPDHTFFGEEGEKADLSNHKGYTWIIDPIDGTKSYIRDIPAFGSLLALLHNGELVVGISNVPAWGELIYAAKGEGAYLNNSRLHVSDVAALPDAYLSSGRLAHFEMLDRMPQLLEASRQARWARGIGDSWAYNLLAQGKIDVMMEGSIKFWDIAAVKVIVEEAGGLVTQLNGQPLTYESSTVLASNGSLHAQVVSIMQ